MVSGVEFSQTMPYAHAAERYLEAGWSPLPLYPGARLAKGVPPKGFTGRNGRMAAAEDVSRWVESDGGRAIGLRLPPGTVGIDVDAYEPKRGGATWLSLREQHGELPPTWVSSARDDLYSGIHFYRIPEHVSVVPAQLGLDVDLIHFGYRFARVWPSMHPGGMMYRWVNPQGRIEDEAVPVVTDLPWLPDAWLPLLQSGSGGEDENDGEWRSSEAYLKPDIQRLRTEGLPLDCNHDNTLSQAVFDLCRLGASDLEAEQAWQDIVSHTELKDPRWPFTEADFHRHLGGARRKLRETAVQPAQRAWAEARAANNGTGTAEASRAPEAAEVTLVVDEATRLNQVVEALIARGEDGVIRLPATHDRLPWSDMASADFIISQYAGIFTFSTNSQLWRMWDGTVHAKAEDGNVEYIVQQYARSYRLVMDQVRTRAIAEAQLGEEALTPAQALEQYRQVWRKHRQYRDAIWNNPGQSRVLRQLRDQLAVSEEKFDTAEGIVIADNGVMAITRGGVELLPHDSFRFVTKRLAKGVRWDPAAEAPHFTRFLETSVPDAEQRRWLQAQLGLALVGRPEKGFINLIGQTNSGKSTLIRALQSVLGSYAASVSIETFLEGGGNTDFRLHELKGARYVFASEPAANRRLDSEIIKAVTGRDLQRTREPYGRFVEWKPCCLITIASNQPQRFETSDVAMLQRIGPIGFWQPAELDSSLDEKLRGERHGVLRWLADGAVRGLRGATAMPVTMLSLREGMAVHVDDVLRWLDEALRSGWLVKDDAVSDHQCISVAAAYQMYTAWCAGEGISVRFMATKKSFSARIRRRFSICRSDGSRFQHLRSGETEEPPI